MWPIDSSEGSQFSSLRVKLLLDSNTEKTHDEEKSRWFHFHGCNFSCYSHPLHTQHFYYYDDTLRSQMEYFQLWYHNMKVGQNPSIFGYFDTLWQIVWMEEQMLWQVVNIWEDVSINYKSRWTRELLTFHGKNIGGARKNILQTIQTIDVQCAKMIKKIQ